MTASAFGFCLTCLLLGKTAQTSAWNSFSPVQQESNFISAKTGDSLTLKCFHKGDIAARLYWYKETVGQKPRPISTSYMYDKIGTFYNEFKNNPRFTLDTENGNSHLTITDLHTSDSATYYCIGCYLYTLEISETTVVSVKGSDLNIEPLVHQSVSETIQPGGSVTLNCTIHTGTCDGEHSVYWFKEKESYPGLIYMNGGRNDQCKKNPKTQTHTCFYNLPMKSLNRSHAGTYYCAVASCGHILFGNGTKLDFEEFDMVHFWHGASAFTTISVLLAFFVCTMKGKNCCKCTKSSPRCAASGTVNTEGNPYKENLYYAALSGSRSRRQREPTWSECVYYSVKQ